MTNWSRIQSIDMFMAEYTHKYIVWSYSYLNTCVTIVQYAHLRPGNFDIEIIDIDIIARKFEFKEYWESQIWPIL